MLLDVSMKRETNTQMLLDVSMKRETNTQKIKLEIIYINLQNNRQLCILDHH